MKNENDIKGYEFFETHHALSIIKGSFPDEYMDLKTVLDNFSFSKSDILAAGGGKTDIASKIDKYLYSKGWSEKTFDIKIQVDGDNIEIPTHKVDCYKNKIAIEVEWNNKDTFFDRDLNNFRLLFELGAIDCGVIITRSTELQKLFHDLVKSDKLSKDKYVSSTTHTNKLKPKLMSKGAGGCPVAVFGINLSKYKG